MSSTSSRDKEIRNLRQKDPKRWRYRVLGEIYHLSEQRVRQICVEETHEDIFEKRADILSKYALRLRSLNEEEISAEIAMLTASSRIKENVLKRGLLVVFLIKRGGTYYGIGKTLKRHHTSIMNLYKKFEQYY